MLGTCFCGFPFAASVSSNSAAFSPACARRVGNSRCRMVRKLQVCDHLGIESGKLSTASPCEPHLRAKQWELESLPGWKWSANDANDGQEKATARSEARIWQKLFVHRCQ